MTLKTKLILRLGDRHLVGTGIGNVGLLCQKGQRLDVLLRRNGHIVVAGDLGDGDEAKAIAIVAARHCIEFGVGQMCKCRHVCYPLLMISNVRAALDVQISEQGIESRLPGTATLLVSVTHTIAPQSVYSK
jgi:hypothetical protein